jgi:hypothetical protein
MLANHQQFWSSPTGMLYLLASFLLLVNQVNQHTMVFYSYIMKYFNIMDYGRHFVTFWLFQLHLFFLLLLEPPCLVPKTCWCSILPGIIVPKENCDACLIHQPSIAVHFCDVCWSHCVPQLPMIVKSCQKSFVWTSHVWLVSTSYPFLSWSTPRRISEYLENDDNPIYVPIQYLNIVIITNRHKWQHIHKVHNK